MITFLTEPEPARGQPQHVAPGIRRLVAPNPGPMTYWGTNTYLIDAGLTGAGQGVLVLDPGPDDAGHAAAVLAVADGPIVGILLSHTHQDHLGATAALRAATGAPVHAWHCPATPALVPDVRLQEGDAAFGWRALHTPGHAADHLCFAGPDGLLFSADHVMGWSTSVVGPPGGNMRDYFASLERLLVRDDAIYLPGHGPSLPQPRPFVQALLEHRRAREKAIEAALEQDARSIADLTAEVYPGVSPALIRAAERNVGAHLDKLHGEGRARDTGTGWARP